MPLCACLGSTEKAQALKAEGDKKPSLVEKITSKPKVTLARKRVYVTRNIHEDALAMLQDKFEVQVWHSDNKVPREKLIEDVRGVSAILCTVAENIDEEILDAAGSSLKVICSMTSGVSHIDEAACKKKGVTLHHVANLCADVNAEVTVALLLMTCKRLMEGYDAVVNGEWGEWKPMWLCGRDLINKTLGFLGFGRVGLGVARRMEGFGLKRMIYFSRTDQALPRAVEAERVGDPNQIFAESDFIICCLTLTPETTGFVNKYNLSLCKPECVFVNTSRAEIVNQEDALACLQSGCLGGLGLDVTTPEPLPPTHPLLQDPRCVILPHMGTATTATRRRMAIHLAKTLVDELH